MPKRRLYMWQYNYANYLTHHGIKGQKWGIRRFQNEDGSLTDAGRKRYSDDYAEAYNLRKKGRNALSNAELKKVNERRRLEDEYNRLNASSFMKGMAYVSAAAVATNTVLNLYNNSNKIYKIGKDYIDTQRRLKALFNAGG